VVFQGVKGRVNGPPVKLDSFASVVPPSL